MPQIPYGIEDCRATQALGAAGLRITHRGKVRDTFSVNEALMAVVASDRVSAHDFVLRTPIPDKGTVLAAMTVFGLTRVLSSDVRHHLVAFGSDIDQYLPFHLRTSRERREDGTLRDIFSRTLVVRKLDMIPVECVVRGYLLGTGWKAYQDTGEVCGHKLPHGLTHGARLPHPIFTPTTKAQVGHDVHLSREEVNAQYGPELERLSLAIYGTLRDYAEKRDIIFADTKFEFGRDEHGVLVLGDEAGTPDSSRNLDAHEYASAQTRGEVPAGFDKQPLRDFLAGLQTPFARDGRPIVGIHRLDPANPRHVEFVHSLELPKEVVHDLSHRYLMIFRRLTGMSLRDFHRKVMKIAA